MKYSECKILALAVMRDAVNDVTGKDDSDPDNIIYNDTSTGMYRRLKENAIDFFFSQESERYVAFWCDMCGQPLARFRNMLKKYK